MEFKEIEEKYRDLIEIAVNYMRKSNDKEHDVIHMLDVVNYTKILLNMLEIEVNYDVCIISAYWHDVGRVFVAERHEKKSAEMLLKEMTIRNYPANLIKQCYKAIENHKWNMIPETNEGLIIRDADKLDFVGVSRWKNCLDNNQSMEKIIELLPDLREKILYFEESRQIYDKEIIKLIDYLYKRGVV